MCAKTARSIQRNVSVDRSIVIEIKSEYYHVVPKRNAARQLPDSAIVTIEVCFFLVMCLFYIRYYFY